MFIIKRHDAAAVDGDDDADDDDDGDVRLSESSCKKQADIPIQMISHPFKV